MIVVQEDPLLVLYSISILRMELCCHTIPCKLPTGHCSPPLGCNTVMEDGGIVKLALLKSNTPPLSTSLILTKQTVEPKGPAPGTVQE